MEIIGLGSDIVECHRIGRMIERHGELFLNRVFTRREIRFCQARKNATEHFAGRWAAKEAVRRCLGAAGRAGLKLTDMEIRLDARGVPRLHLGGAARERARSLHLADVLITISHCRAYATACALALAAAPG